MAAFAFTTGSAAGAGDVGTAKNDNRRLTHFSFFIAVITFQMFRPSLMYNQPMEYFKIEDTYINLDQITRVVIEPGGQIQVTLSDAIAALTIEDGDVAKAFRARLGLPAA
jgi:hypothetical protein